MSQDSRRIFPHVKTRFGKFSRIHKLFKKFKISPIEFSPIFLAFSNPHNLISYKLFLYLLDCAYVKMFLKWSNRKKCSTNLFWTELSLSQCFSGQPSNITFKKIKCYILMSFFLSCYTNLKNLNIWHSQINVNFAKITIFNFVIKC